MKYLLILTIIATTLFIGCASYYTHDEPQNIPPAPAKEDIGSGFYRVTEATSLYENADVGSRKIQSVKSGEIVEVVDVSGAFAQIKYSENAGWIHRMDVEDTPMNSVVRTLGEVSVKAQPSSNSGNVAILEPGRLLTLKKREGDWLYVKISENRGWLMAGLLEPLGVTRQKASPRSTSDRVYWEVLKKSNLRSSPNIVSEILRLMPAGSTVIYLGEDGDWVHVEYDGTIGFVHQDLVAPY